jgi:hypothetical protein
MIPFSIIFLLFLIILGSRSRSPRRFNGSPPNFAGAAASEPNHVSHGQDLQALADTNSRSNRDIIPWGLADGGPWPPGELQVAAAQTRIRNFKLSFKPELRPRLGT